MMLAMAKNLLLPLVDVDEVAVRLLKSKMRDALVKLVLPVVFVKYLLFLHLTNHPLPTIDLIEILSIGSRLRNGSHLLATSTSNSC